MTFHSRNNLRLGLGTIFVIALGWSGLPAFAAETTPVRDAVPPRASNPLVWDAMEKTIDAKPDEGAAEFEFKVTNVSDRAVEVIELRPTCGCTVAELPAKPWILAAGAKGSFRATIDFRGKRGRVSKGIYVVSNAGTQLLSIAVNVPEVSDPQRALNQKVAATDRQAVFRGDCARCHAAPTVGKVGAELFREACLICHIASPHRASMVPDLLVAREPRDAAFWRKWISEGKEESLMPAFAQEKGGPLAPAQIDSLVEFALASLPTHPPPAETVTRKAGEAVRR